MPDNATTISRSGVQPIRENLQPVREGGMYEAGLLPNVSLISRGEAVGWYFWIDEALLASLATALQIATRELDGIKCRFNHPFASADSLGNWLGRVTARSERETADALAAGWLPCDVHFSKAGHNGPNGDLATYVMDRSEEDAASLGLSAIFRRNTAAELDFMLAHGGQIETQPDGQEIVVGFQSPDPANVNNLPHARLAELRAADVVGDPAANPGGLRGPVAGLSGCDEFWKYALGLINDRPALVALDVDPDRLRNYLQDFLQRETITLTAGDPEMTRKTSQGVAHLDANGNQADDQTASQADDQQATAAADDAAADDQTADQADDQQAAADDAAAGDQTASQADDQQATAADDDAAADDQTASQADDQQASSQQTVALSELPKWQKLGPNAMQWLADGKSYQEALELRTAELEASNTELAQLNQLARGEADPVTGNSQPDASGQRGQDADTVALGAADKTGNWAAEQAEKIAKLNQPSSN